MVLPRQGAFFAAGEGGCMIRAVEIYGADGVFLRCRRWKFAVRAEVSGFYASPDPEVLPPELLLPPPLFMSSLDMPRRAFFTPLFNSPMR